MKSRGICDYEKQTKSSVIFMCTLEIYWFYAFSVYNPFKQLTQEELKILQGRNIKSQIW